MHPDDWNEEKRVVRRSRKDCGDLNGIIAAKVGAAEAALNRARLRGKAPTADDVKRALNRKGRRDFYAFTEEAITRMEQRGKADSARRYRHVVLKKFKGFTGSPLPFERIDVRLLREFETKLIAKGNAASTVATNFRAIRSVYNKGVAEGLAEPADNPFLRFRPAPVPPKRKEKLTDAEMRRIEEVELKAGSAAAHARDAFVFSFYCAGMRFKDVCLLRRSDLRHDGEEWRLHYTMSKTADAFALKVPVLALEIARRYGLEDEPTAWEGRGEDPAPFLFPFLQGADLSTPEKLRRVKDSRNVVVNKQLKRVAKKAKVKKDVSFHLSRHSFADLARVRGIDLHTISKALGHSSLTVTENYLKGFDQDAIDGAMDELFGGATP